ncbi:hypothetical protein SAMN05661012_02546 [Chitinophaga sancti]|uniref:Uncharacterized protein n=1 Tax=Chitinophaga sancti TaxID=1004 RepID=A0A1K1Q8C0_9BACT|nr:hypothetical protein SAMN05661012_02546 [Chitinophaga sancti]
MIELHLGVLPANDVAREPNKQCKPGYGNECHRWILLHCICKFLYMVQINPNYQAPEIADFRDKIQALYNIMKINPL